MNDAEKAYQYFVIAVPENEEQAKAYFWARKALQPTLTPPNDMDLGFDVIDTKTGEYPDLGKIALTEEWARGLVYCDMDGFAVREDGSLVLLDECGNCVSCPPGRFDIRLQDGSTLPNPPNV